VRAERYGKKVDVVGGGEGALLHDVDLASRSRRLTFAGIQTDAHNTRRPSKVHNPFLFFRWMIGEGEGGKLPRAKSTTTKTTSTTARCLLSSS